MSGQEGTWETQGRQGCRNGARNAAQEDGIKRKRKGRERKKEQSWGRAVGGGGGGEEERTEGWRQAVGFWKSVAT